MSGCRQKEYGGDLCPIVAELAVKVTKRDATISKLEAGIQKIAKQATYIKGEEPAYIIYADEFESLVALVKS